MVKVKELEIHFGEHKILWRKRAFRRSISISVKADGHITVSSALFVSQHAIVEFLKEKETWLKKILAKFKAEKPPLPPSLLIAGSSVLFLGQKRSLIFEEALGSRASLLSRERAFLLRGTQTHRGVCELLAKHYKRAAMEAFPRRMQYWSERMGLVPKKLSFRSQKTRWGSCSSAGHISLNWKLMAAPPEVIDYVIVHELCHLKYPHHQVSFWNLVETQIPHHKELRRWLRVNHQEFHFLKKN